MMKTKDETMTEGSDSQALTLFQPKTPASKLPAAVQGILKNLRTREQPGFAPQWKPEKKGEFLLGRVLSLRQVLTEFGETVVLTFQCHDGEIVSIFPGVDLRMKLAGAAPDQVYCITYEGIVTKKDNPRLKNNMKQYTVVEVLPD